MKQASMIFAICVDLTVADLCAVKQGVNCNGDDILSGKLATSAEDCCAQCQATDGCVAWTWNNGGDQNCWVKRSCSRPLHGQPTISGGAVPPGPAPPSFPWNDVNRSAKERAHLLVKALSTTEKIQMMVTSAVGVPHLAVPDFEWSNEGLHGIAWHGRSTVFPAPIGLAATFDRSVLTTLGEVDAKEARAKHYHGDGVGLSLFAPNINIFRDPRWGRGQETYGEDPVLAGELAKAFVATAQTPFIDSKVKPVLMTDKHYAVYNLESNFAPPLNGTDGQYRLRFYANATESDLEFTYLVSHAHAVEAGVGSVMCAYNAVNNLPMCANQPLLDRLRKDLGFKGLVVTDCGAIGFSVDPMHHFDSHVTASAQALIAGTNVNCGSEFSAHLQQALDQELISEDLIDERLRPGIIARIELGDLDPVDPYKDWYDQVGFDAVVDSEEHRAYALRAAQESLVLLRNSPVNGSPLLPLKETKVAVIGPNANSTDALLSNYGGCRAGAGGAIDPACILLTVLEGVSEHADVTFVEGAEIDSGDTTGIAAAASAAAAADVAVVVLGLKTCQETGPMCQEAEAFDRHHINLPGVQEQLLQAVLEANPRTVLVLLNGGAVSGDFYTSVPAVLEAFYPGALGGRAVAQTLFGKSSPAGRLPYTVVQSVDQLANYYSMDMTDAPGRTYRYSTQEPGFAFGFGLSYASFEYSGASAHISGDGSVSVTLTVKNTGMVTSDDVVMVFAGGSRMDGAPKIGLVGFERVKAVVAGDSARVVVDVSALALAAQGFGKGSPPKLLKVGGRAPGSPGKWVDWESFMPPEPLTVTLDPALLTV